MDSPAPGYISSHSADVILSDIRPIKLKKDALNALNILTDEFLFNILSAARSLQTDRLRAGLLQLLPTSLGKEALLEAEVELRAYWDRTNPKGGPPTPSEDDSKTFNLTWSYELLRLKCEAYSTLNESDEDPAAEARLQNRMVSEGAPSSPKPTLVAPAALYLTAILESICEHILSDVARVAARDSSRTGATSQDLFVALCEDDAIYGLFKTMKVYEQIEQLAQGPRPRRSKSMSRTEKLSISQTSSQEHSSGSGRDTPGNQASHRSRLSSDTTIVGNSSTNSRSSFEKGRGMKKLIGSRTSHDRDGESPTPYRTSGSLHSDENKDDLFEDEDALQEFDSLMKSGATMKVSLTPDRLRSMEQARKQKEDSSSQPSPSQGRRPTPRHVHSITEDEEETGATSSKRTPSAVNGVSSPPQSMSSRTRTTSSSSGRPAMNQRPSNGVSTNGSRGGPRGIDADPFPQKTRRVQRNRESLDLDDIMNGSDGDEENKPPPPKPVSKTAPASPPPKVSARTREMIDFLNDGPPDPSLSGPPHLSKAGRDLVEFLNQGPPGSNTPPMSPESRKGTGRLQRMMSKLSMNTSERGKSEEGQRLSRQTSAPVQPNQPTLHKQQSAGNLNYLANRPVPPRFPRPISPPASPSDEQHSVNRQRAVSASRAPPSAWDSRNDAEPPALPAKTASLENSSSRGNPTTVPNGHIKANSDAQKTQITRIPPPQIISPPISPDSPDADPSQRMTSKTGPSTIETASRPLQNVIPVQPALPAGQFSEDDAKHIRRLFGNATNADECRVLLEIFLAKSGRPVEHQQEIENPYPSPSPSEHVPSDGSSKVDVGVEPTMENSLVGLFLGGEKIADPVSTPRKRRTRRKSASKSEREQVLGPEAPAASPAAPRPSVSPFPSLANRRRRQIIRASPCPQMSDPDALRC